MKKNLCKHAVIATAFGVILSACASMSTMQTARTTEQGEFAYSVGVGQVQTEADLFDTTVTIKMPMIEIAGRFGIIENLDAGFKMTLIGTFVGDVKYQFYGDNSSLLAASGGFGLGRLTMTSGVFENKTTDLMFPVFASVHPTDWIGVYMSPKYIFRLNKSTNTETKESESFNSHWYGATMGVRLGRENALFAEYSLFANNVSDFNFKQINVGVGFKIR